MNATARSSSGRYEYCCNGQPCGIDESWEISQQGGKLLISSERRVAATGITLRVESRQQDNRFEDCTLDWHQLHGSAETHIVAHYRFTATTLQVLRQKKARPPATGPEQEAPVCEPMAGVVFSPLMRIFTGGTIRALVNRGGSGRVLVPWIRDPHRQDQLLLPLFSERHATVVAENTVRAGDQPQRGRVYEYSGGEYQPGTRFWLDENDLLLHYRWHSDPDTCWEVSLRDLQQEP